MKRFWQDPSIKLTDSEIKVFNFLSKNKKQIPFLTMEDLASKINISRPTIMRLSKKLGYKNYTHLKKDFKKFIKNQQMLPIFTNKTIDSHYKLLLELDRINSKHKLKKVTKIFARSRKVLIFSVGTSSLVANILSARLLQSGVSAYTQLPGDINTDTLKHISVKDAIVIISYTGKTKLIKDFLKIIPKETSVVSFTSNNNSALQKGSNISLFVPIIHESENEHFASRLIPFISLIESIVIKIKK